MRITLLDVKGFGRLKQLKINPQPGLNVIYGSNESGKSTLQTFILAMLYGLKKGRKSKDGTPPPLKRYRPWDCESYAGIMEYSLSDGSKFTVGRNFDKGSINIYDERANHINLSFPQDRESGPKFSEEQLGIDEAAFERSCFIRQIRCAVDETGRKSLIERLSNLNTSADEDFSLSKAVKALETAALERVGTDRSTIRPLNRINTRISELENRKQEIIELNERYLDTASSLHYKKKLLLKLEKEKELNDIVRVKKEISEKIALQKELEKKQEFLESELDKEDSYKKKTSNAKLIIVIIDILIAISSFMAFIYTNQPLFLVTALLAAVLSVLVWPSISQGALNHENKEAQLLKRELFEKNIQEYEKTEKDLSELKERLNKLGLKWDELELTESGDYLKTNTSAEAEETEKYINDLKHEITILETRLEQVPDEGELTGITEELTSLEEKRESLIKTGESLILASEILKDASCKIQKDYIPLLEKEMGQIMGFLTQDTYSCVKTNDTAQILVTTPSTHELIPIEVLSRGTIDQIYLAMRLAMVRLIEKNGEPLPLIMDEPFSQYDEERARSAFKLIKEVTKERQVFLFTCHERDYKLSKEVFDGDFNIINLCANN